MYAHGQRDRSNDYCSRRHSARHQVHFGKPQNATARRGERCATSTDESGRVARSRGVPVARAAILEYCFSSHCQQLTITASPLFSLLLARPRDRRGAYPPGILYEYQNKEDAKIAFRNGLILKDAPLVVFDLQKGRSGCLKEKSGSKLPHSIRSNLQK